MTALAMLTGLFGEVRWLVQDDAIARWTALVVWTGIAGMLTIPARRRLFGVPLSTDDLLFAAWMLMLNRVCFSVNALAHNDAFADFTRWSGIGAGVFYAYVVSSYIRAAGTVGDAGA